MVAAAGDGNVWIVGGGDLVGQFHDAGLLDQVVVGIAPVTLGAGAPLLPRRIEGLRLVEVARNGQMVEPDLRRAPSAEPQTGSSGPVRPVGAARRSTGSPGRTSPPRRTTPITPARRTTAPSASRPQHLLAAARGWKSSICRHGLRSPVTDDLGRVAEQQHGARRQREQVEAAWS